MPRQQAARDTGGECESVCADVFAAGRSAHLPADSSDAADRKPNLAITVRILVHNICDSLLTATDATGSVATLEECVPDLHLARLQPGGRRMGGWLVPTYQPSVYLRTLRTAVPP